MFRCFCAFLLWSLGSCYLRHPPHGHAPAPNRHLVNVLDCSRPMASFWARLQLSRKCQAHQRPPKALRRTRALIPRRMLRAIPPASPWILSLRASHATIFVSTNSLQASTQGRLPKSTFFPVGLTVIADTASKRAFNTSFSPIAARTDDSLPQSATELALPARLVRFCLNCEPCVMDAEWHPFLAFCAALIHLSWLPQMIPMTRCPTYL